MTPRGCKRPLCSSEQLPQILVSEQPVIEAPCSLPGDILTDLLRTSSSTRASRQVLSRLLLLNASYPSGQTTLSEISRVIRPLVPGRRLHSVGSAIRRCRFLVLQVNPRRISDSEDGPNTRRSPLKCNPYKSMIKVYTDKTNATIEETNPSSFFSLTSPTHQSSIPNKPFTMHGMDMKSK